MINTEFTESRPGKCGGRPCVRGHRFTVAQVLVEVAERGGIEAFCKEFWGHPGDEPAYTCHMIETVKGVLCELANLPILNEGIPRGVPHESPTADQ